MFYRKSIKKIISLHYFETNLRRYFKLFTSIGFLKDKTVISILPESILSTKNTDKTIRYSSYQNQTSSYWLV